MTPEQIEEIQGIEPQMVERIQESVNAYYGQFEEGQGGGNAEPTEPEATQAEPDAIQAEHEGAQAEREAIHAEPEATQAEPDAIHAEPEAAQAEPEATHAEPEAARPSQAIDDAGHPPGALSGAESPQERFDPGSPQAESVPVEQFGNMEGAGSPTDNQSEEGLAGGPEGTSEGGVPPGPEGGVPLGPEGGVPLGPEGGVPSGPSR
jgi:hypothetical protein